MRDLRGSCSVFADALGLVPCHVSCLAWLAPCSACLARLACSIRLPIPHAPAQWSDRPQGRSAGVTARVGLGPLCHGYVFVRESVVGQRWGFLFCVVACPTKWCAHWKRRDSHRLQGNFTTLHATYPRHSRISATAH